MICIVFVLSICHKYQCENNTVLQYYVAAAYKDRYNLMEAGYKTAFDNRLLVSDYIGIDKNQHHIACIIQLLLSKLSVVTNWLLLFSEYHGGTRKGGCTHCRWGTGRYVIFSATHGQQS